MSKTKRDREEDQDRYKFKERPGWFRGAWVGGPRSGKSTRKPK
jgi:hypothetical protein